MFRLNFQRLIRGFLSFYFLLINHSIRFNWNQAGSDKQYALAICIGLVFRHHRLLHPGFWEFDFLHQMFP